MPSGWEHTSGQSAFIPAPVGTAATPLGGQYLGVGAGVLDRDRARGGSSRGQPAARGGRVNSLHPLDPSRVVRDVQARPEPDLKHLAVQPGRDPGARARELPPRRTRSIPRGRIWSAYKPIPSVWHGLPSAQHRVVPARREPCAAAASPDPCTLSRAGWSGELDVAVAGFPQ